MMNFVQTVVTLLTIIHTAGGLKYDGKLCTVGVCNIDEPSLRFFMLGDWGGRNDTFPTTAVQLRVAEAMQELHNNLKVHFVLTVGDNFYKNGVENASDPRFNITFENVYDIGKAEDLPWYIVAGNHDHDGNVSAQVVYSNHSNRWIFPNLSYVFHYNLTQTGTTVDFIMLDTQALCEYKSKVSMGSNISAEYASQTKAWLEMQLQKSRATYVFVAGHFNMFSTGYHGNQKCPSTRTHDLLVKYNVTAFLCGHDHHLEHLTASRSDGRPFHHIISGGGASFYKKRNDLTKRNRHIQVPSLKSEFFYNDETSIPAKIINKEIYYVTGGFVYAELTSQAITFSFFTGGKNYSKLYVVQVEPVNRSVPASTTSRGHPNGPNPIWPSLLVLLIWLQCEIG